MFRLFFFLLFGAAACWAGLTEDQRNSIDRITGVKGAYTAAEDVHRVAFPRNDLKMTVDGWPMQPFMGITSWAAFTSTSSSEGMVMGDLTLAEDEVNAVMSVALDNGLEVTALHNHFFYDEPRVMFMHIGGHGKIQVLAEAVRKCVDKVAEIRKGSPAPAKMFSGSPLPAQSSLSAPPLEAALNAKAQANNGMLKFQWGRMAKAHGHQVGNQMGVNTWAAFAGSDANAFVDGDFAMLENELQGVLKALRGAGINVVAIHNHMSGEQPHYFFLHYWGKGRAADLAKAVQAARNTQAKY